MKSHQPRHRTTRIAFALCACALVATTGCFTKQRQRQSIDALQKEMRWQEDQIYQLQDAIEQYQDALAHCRAGGKPDTNSSRSTSPTPDRTSDDIPSGVPELPRVELGEPDNESGLPPIQGVPSFDNTTPKSDSPTDDRLKPLDTSSSQVREIRLHTVLTGGIDRDGLPGDEGIQVMIEPLNAQGNVVSVSGAVAIAMMDHTLPAGDQRLAFWTFDAEKSADKIQRGGLSDGLLFDLMWGGQRYPSHRVLDVYVRYTTSDGRHLDTRGKVRVRLPEDVAAWKQPDRQNTRREQTPSTIRPVAGFEALPLKR
jgi:hypothetical protein